MSAIERDGAADGHGDAPRLPVVAAVIERDGLVLLAQRPAHKAQGLRWEFPGGKVEPGEDPRRALERELAEELGCSVRVSDALGVVDHDYPAIRIRLTFFQCALEAGEPVAHEHAALAWLEPGALADADLCAADRTFVERVFCPPRAP